MEEVKLLNFAKFFFISQLEEIDHYFYVQNIKPSQTKDGQEKILEFLKQKKQELLLIQGQKFKMEYDKAKAKDIEVKAKNSSEKYSDIEKFAGYPSLQYEDGEEDTNEQESNVSLDILRVLALNKKNHL